MPDQEYLFDFLHQLVDWALVQPKLISTSRSKTRPAFTYQIFFMRKIWINIRPSEDPNADLILHYYQEMPKYLRGYHHLTKAQCARFGALILRAQTRDDKSPPWAQFQHVIQDLLPIDKIKACSQSEWKKVSSTFTTT